MAVDVRAAEPLEIRSGDRAILAVLCLVGGIAPLAGRALPGTAAQLVYGLAVAAALLMVTVVLRRSSGASDLWPLSFAFFVFATVQVLNNAVPPFVQTSLLHETSVSGDPLGSSVGGTVVIQLLEAVLAVVPILVLTRAAGFDLGSVYARVGRVGRWHIVAVVAFVGLFVLFGIVPSHRYIPIHGTLTLGRYLALAPALLVMALSNGFEEEFLFRGLFLQRFTALFGFAWANVLQALIFSYAHVGVSYTPSAVLFIVATVLPLGLAAGYVMRKSDGVVAPALLHGGVDIAIYLAFLTAVS